MRFLLPAGHSGCTDMLIAAWLCKCRDRLTLPSICVLPTGTGEVLKCENTDVLMGSK